jgi:Rhs element Vgr protein
MAISSPVTEKTDLVSFAIMVNGKEINGAYQVFSIFVENAVNRIPAARIHILDGTPSGEDFPISDSDDFIPGNSITINTGYHSNNSTIFSGIIIKQSLKITQRGGSMLIVECRDKAIKMTVGRKNAVFVGKTDSDAISEVISGYGLDKSVEATTPQLPEIIQFYASDWDFMLTRADVNGQIVVVDQGKITISKPDTSKDPVLSVKYGASLVSIDVTMDSRSQLSAVQSSSWDMKTQALINANAVDPGFVLPGNITSATLAGVMSPSDFHLQSTVPLDQQSLQVWANARLAKAQLAKITGTAQFQGSSLIKPGLLLQIEGLGSRFNGNAFVSGIRNRLENGEWATEADLGWSSEWFAESELNIMAAPASSQIPGVQGLQNGVVIQIDEDPDNEYRVLVRIPLIDSDSKGVWARMAQMYATNNAGSFFYPEVGDEVLLGFLNDDPRYPVILGSMYSSAKTAPFEPDKENINKGLVTNGQLKITFDDKKLITSITTPKKNSIVLSEADEKITITDQNNNTITMSSDGVSIKSIKDVNIDAQGNISLNATGNIDIKATANLTASGMQISATAEAEAKIHGNASAELSASGQVVVQGAMVMIN